MKSIALYLRMTLLVMFTLWGSILCAQTTTQDVVYFKDGSIIRGKVVEYKTGGKIKIKILGGSLLVYDTKDVHKMEKETIKADDMSAQKGKKRKNAYKERPNHFVEKGMYYMIGFGNVGAALPPSIPLFGLTADATVGWRLSPYIQFGGGLNLMAELNHSFLQGYGHMRFNLLNRSFSPYFDAQVGYGLLLSPNAIRLQSNMGSQRNGIAEIRDARGGFYARPALGMRFASRNKVHCFLDVGCTIQQAYYEGVTSSQFFYKEKRLIMRPSIRVGMVF